MHHLRVLVLSLFLAVTAVAEHRVALVIGNAKYENDALGTELPNLPAVTRLYERFGIRATILADLTGERLREAVESFARSTPTRGTAIVHFVGRVRPGNHKGKDGLFLVGTDADPRDPRRIGSAGIDVAVVLRQLDTLGGAQVNAVVLESPDNPKLDPSLNEAVTEGSLLAVSTTKRLADALPDSDDLLDGLRFAATASKSRVDDLRVTGAGSPVVGPPDRCIPGRKAGDEWVNARGMVFCWCPPGSFTAGSPDDEPHRYPDEDQREVTIRDGFWIGKYELTLRENLRNHPRSTIAVRKDDPLTMIHLDDGRTMVQRTLTESERKAKRLPADWQYNLPTEQQWEYAARAGTTTRFHFGADMNELPRYANFGDKSFYESRDVYSNAAHRTLDDGTVRLARVGSYRPNAWGLHDVYGNVAEWCVDGALRGGSWVSRPEHCRSAYRDWWSNRSERNHVGYRLVIQPVRNDG